MLEYPLSTVGVITGYLEQGITRAKTESDSPRDTQWVLTLSQSVPLDVQPAPFHLSPILPFSSGVPANQFDRHDNISHDAPSKHSHRTHRL